MIFFIFSAAFVFIVHYFVYCRSNSIIIVMEVFFRLNSLSFFPGIQLEILLKFLHRSINAYHSASCSWHSKSEHIKLRNFKRWRWEPSSRKNYDLIWQKFELVTLIWLTHLFPRHRSLPRENVRKLYAFLMFSGGRKKLHWE